MADMTVTKKKASNLIMGFIIVLSATHACARVSILSSIKPLSLIVQEIVGSSADVDTLLPVSASPHDYPLKVSDYARLQKADLVVWIGPELESFLQKPIANLPAAKTVAAYDLAGLNWPVDSHGDHESNHHHERDPHLWLDPRNAIVVAQAVSEKLVQIDPANANVYRANMQTFATNMKSLDEKLTKQLKPLAGHGFAVYHEGYGHFISHYELHQINFVTFTPEQRPGAKHLQQLREDLAKNGECIFMEPYYELQSVRDLAQELKLRLGVLDALGTQNTQNYTQLLEHMASAFSACLTNRRVE